MKHLMNKEKALKLIEEKDNLSFVSFQNRATTGQSEITCYCKRCGQNFSKTLQSFLKYPKCFYCESRETMNTAGFRAQIPTDYEAIGEFSGTTNFTLFRHKKCGFVWKATPKYFLHYPHCPRCDGKRSKGEQIIAEYFDAKNISYEIEKSFSWQTNPRRRYDFFLPDYNLIIEYMGQQHYFETIFFRIPYEEQRKIDEEKKQDALQNGKEYLAIGYFEIEEINKILDCWFNDYSERK